MKLLLKILTTSVLVMLIASFMKAVEIDNFVTAVIVASLLGLLNIFVKPVLILLSIPATIFTFGLFLFVVNGAIIMICSSLVTGFHVNTFFTAILFSVILSLSQSIAYRIIGEDK